MENLYLNNTSQDERVCAKDGTRFDFLVNSENEDAEQEYIGEITATDGWQGELSYKYINDNYIYNNQYNLILR